MTVLIMGESGRVGNRHLHKGKHLLAFFCLLEVKPYQF